MQQEPHAEALGVHGSEQSELTAKPNLAQRDVAGIIGRLRPWESPQMLRHRVALNDGAVLAANRGTHAGSPDARDEFWAAHRVAARWVTRSASAETLERMRHTVCLMMCAADNLEHCGSGL